MIRHILKAAALSAALASTAQATVITSANPTVFNFSGASAPGTVELVIGGAVGSQTATGTIAYYTGQNLGGALVYTDPDPAIFSTSDRLRNADLFDGFSILITITSGSFDIDPVNRYLDARERPTGGSPGVIGDQSGLNPPPTNNGVPEPGSLLLAVLAGLGLLATSRRRA